ncbi:MAG: amino acid transporter [Cytophagaceae bacterium SCN 52-12]|nr:MAG: amino acid transporter [Cytophagaceae bacterium SCN 52-12]
MNEFSPQENEMRRELGLLDATMLVAGSMIGSGIFIVSSDIVRNVGSAGWLIFVWALTGVITLIAALSYGELSSMFPNAGGQYVYLRAAYGRLVAFLYGWSLFMVIQTGTIAAVGVAFAKFTAYLFPAVGENVILFDAGFTKITAAQVLAISSIVLLSWLNSRSVKSGKITQTIFTIVKILSLGGLIVLGLTAGFKAEIWQSNWTDAWKSMRWDIGTQSAVPLAGAAVFAGIVSAMVGTIFSSDAWNNVTFIAGEIKNPRKNVGLALFLGVLIVTIIYLLTNLMYLATLSLQEIAYAPSDRVAIAAALKIFGATGTAVIAVMVMISTFGCNNGLILSGARVYYTMAKDGLFFEKAGKLNRNEVPGWGLWIQCVWASVLCLTGRYGDLLNYVIFVVLIFYALTIAAVFILRKKYPDMERPYKALGYPVVPFLYVVTAVTIGVGLLIYQPTYTWPGFVIILLGIPVFMIWNREKR